MNRREVSHPSGDNNHFMIQKSAIECACRFFPSPAGVVKNSTCLEEEGRKEGYIRELRLGSELAWNEFVSDRLSNERMHKYASRYVRLNPDSGDRCPRLDAKRKTTELIHSVEDYLRPRDARQTIQQVSYQLVASSFYFDKVSVREPDEQEGCKGGGRNSLPRNPMLI